MSDVDAICRKEVGFGLPLLIEGESWWTFSPRSPLSIGFFAIFLRSTPGESREALKSGRPGNLSSDASGGLREEKIGSCHPEQVVRSQYGLKTLPFVSVDNSLDLGKEGGERVEPHQATRVGRTARKKRPGSRWANVLICRSSKVILVKDPSERCESRDLFPHCRGPVKSCTGWCSSANVAVKSRGYTCVDYKLTTYYRQSPGGHCLSGILPQGFLSVKTDRDRAGRRFFGSWNGCHALLSSDREDRPISLCVTIKP